MCAGVHGEEVIVDECFIPRCLILGFEGCLVHEGGSGTSMQPAYGMWRRVIVDIDI